MRTWHVSTGPDLVLPGMNFSLQNNSCPTYNTPHVLKQHFLQASSTLREPLQVGWQFEYVRPPRIYERSFNFPTPAPPLNTTYRSRDYPHIVAG